MKIHSLLSHQRLLAIFLFLFAISDATLILASAEAYDPEIETSDTEDMNEAEANLLTAQGAAIAGLIEDQIHQTETLETIESMATQIYEKYTALRHRNRQLHEKLENIGSLVQNLITAIQIDVYPVLETQLNSDEIKQSLEQLHKQIAEKILEAYGENQD